MTICLYTRTAAKYHHWLVRRMTLMGVVYSWIIPTQRQLVVSRTEQDRRHFVFLACQTHSDSAMTATNRRPFGFLPVNPKLSAMHNQARQKLATLNSRDFTCLLIDALSECKRRQAGLEQKDPFLSSSDPHSLAHPSLENHPHSTSTTNVTTVGLGCVIPHCA